MKIDIEMRPGSSVAKVTMDAGEVLTAEGGSMIAMSNDMGIETTTHKKGKKGIMKGLKRMLGGEGFFPLDRALRPKSLHHSRGVAASGFRPLRKIPHCCLP